MGEIYFTEKELCEWLRVSRSKVMSLRKEGMPFIKIGKSVRFDKEEVEKWLREKSQN
jgi:excisionase family DNA binding protein